uniref:Energy-coupling factor transporter transmembrane protein EcfT n=1 Tax=Ignisphaera aggregans TaxID=334771 RepID=A0A7J2U6X9_9CREN
MSFSRNLAELFTPLCSSKCFSLYTRISISMAMMLIPMTIQTLFKGQKIIATIYTFILALTLLSIRSNLKRVLRVLTLILIFIVIGFIVIAISKFLGYPTPTLKELILSSVNLVTLFLSISLFFQWTSLRELRWILTKMGMSRLANLTTATLAFLPLLLNNYIEAYIAILMKFGKRKVYKAVNSLIIHTTMIANDVAQAIYLYGLPQTPRVKVERPKLLEVLLIATIVILAMFLIIVAP